MNQSRLGGNRVMMDGTDQYLLRKVSRGDRRALADLYRRHSSLLAARLRHSGASVEETEDILQETFLDVWKSAEAFRGESAVAGWLWGIARRKLSMLVRSEIRLRDRQRKATAGKCRARSEESELVDGLVAEHAFRALDNDLQLAFEAVVIEGMTTAEAAERLGIPTGTVKSRVYRARQIMRKELK